MEKELNLFTEAEEVKTRPVSVSEMAKLLVANGVGVTRYPLFQWLRGNGYLGRSTKDYNRPTVKSKQAGLMKQKYTTHHVGIRAVSSVSALITPEGQRYFLDGFKAGRFVVPEAASFSVANG